MKSETFRTLDKRRKIFVLAVIIGCMGIVGAVQAAGTDYQNNTITGGYWGTSGTWTDSGSSGGIPGTDPADTVTISDTGPGGNITGVYVLLLGPDTAGTTTRTIDSLNVALATAGGSFRPAANTYGKGEQHVTWNITNDFALDLAKSTTSFIKNGGGNNSTLDISVGNFSVVGGGSLTFGQTGNTVGTQENFGGLVVSGASIINTTTTIGRVSTALSSDIFDFGSLTVGGSLNLASSTSGVITNTVRVNSLSSSGGGALIRVNSNAGDDSAVLVIQGNSTAEYAGQLLDGGSGNTFHLTKTGTGTQILSGTNTYTGATTVENGTLLINSSLAAGSAVSVTGGTLGGSGTVNGAVTVDGDAVLLGGTGLVGTTLTLNGNLTLEEDSIIALTLGDGLTHSVLKRTGAGTWSFDENQRFTLSGSNLEVGTYSGVIIGLADDPDVTNWTITNAGITGTFSYNAGNIDLTLGTIPEPRGMALIGGLLLLGWGMYRRFRHRTSL